LKATKRFLDLPTRGAEIRILRMDASGERRFTQNQCGFCGEKTGSEK
jgi:hypothetical protein